MHSKQWREVVQLAARGWRGEGGGCDVGEEVVVRFVLLEERGPHRDWSNVEEMGASPKIPASPPVAGTAIETVENNVDTVG